PCARIRQAQRLMPDPHRTRADDPCVHLHFFITIDIKFLDRREQGKLNNDHYGNGRYDFLLAIAVACVDSSRTRRGERSLPSFIPSSRRIACPFSKTNPFWCSAAVEGLELQSCGALPRRGRR